MHSIHWLLSFLVVTMVGYAEVTLVRDGKAVATIYMQGALDVQPLTPKERRTISNEEQSERLDALLVADAVKDLVYHVERMSGATLLVRSISLEEARNLPAGEAAILVGQLAVEAGAAPLQETTMGESYRLVSRPNRLLIGSEGPLGTSHGIHGLLATLGCDWLMPGPMGEIIPSLATVVVPTMDIGKSPAFEVRANWYSGGRLIVTDEELAQLRQWKLRHGQTPREFAHRHPDFMHGGHFWNSVLRHYKDTRLKEDPTMYALVRQPDGSYVRGKSQLDPLHPGVLDMCADYIRGMFERNKWPNDKRVALNVGPNDGGGYSESAEVITEGGGRFDPIAGDRDQTDVLVLYTNRLIEMLEPEFPNLRLGLLIYSVHADYPMRHKPHPKFIGHFADITYSRFHALEDTSSPTRNYYRNILEQWAELHEEQGNPLWFYGYNWNLAENLLPYTKMKIWGLDLPYYHEMGVKGHNNEQDKAWSILGPHNYLMARLGWDMELEWEDVLDEYCAKAFGAGGTHMAQYYLNLIERQERHGHEAGSHFAMPLVFDQEFVQESRALFAKAAAAAETDTLRERVAAFSQPVEMLHLYLNFIDALHNFDYVRATGDLEAMVAHWDACLAQDSNLVSRYGRRYMEWLYKPVAEQGKRYSTGEYRIAHRLPEALPTRFDPTLSGHLMGFQLPAVPHDNLLKTHTYGSTWMTQGLGGYRQGSVWYFDTFTLEELSAEEGVGLFIGAVEDEIHVWCNGTYIGKGRGYVRPFQFDLTGSIRRDGENTIALQVIRNSMLNELGLGGMLYPSFVFAGPRLEQQAPAIEPHQRILPGGGRE